MHKALILFYYIFLITGLSAWPLSTYAYQETVRTPTAPPPPRATNTKTRLPPPRPTNTPTVPSNSGWKTRTPTASPSPTLTTTPTFMETLTPTATFTITPTHTPTLTPTPFLNLHVEMYLDINKDNLFEFGEGVDNLLLLVNAGRWAAQAILQDGEVWLALPADLIPGSDVQVQAPYLHWSNVLRAPKEGEILEATLRLVLPQFPVSLP